MTPLQEYLSMNESTRQEFVKFLEWKRMPRGENGPSGCAGVAADAAESSPLAVEAEEEPEAPIRQEKRIEVKAQPRPSLRSRFRPQIKLSELRTRTASKENLGPTLHMLSKSTAAGPDPQHRLPFFLLNNTSKSDQVPIFSKSYK
jgi:hypothetical protein